MAMSHSLVRQKEQHGAASSEMAEEDDELFEEAPFDSIDKVQTLGVNAADITKLKKAGLATVGSVLKTARKELEVIKGLSDAKIEKIMEACRKISGFGFITGNELCRKRASVFGISTGSTQFDQLLAGGVESSSITEVFGEFRTGKTQLCHTLCVTAQLPRDMNGGNGKVFYIDTEGTFRPDRIRPIAERFGMDPDGVLDNIIYARVYTHDQQMEIMTAVAAKIAEDAVNYSLMVIDSVMALFRVDYSGRGELSERQQKLGKHLSNIIKIAEEFNIAVLLVNQVCADPGSTAVFVKDPKKPVGGNILAHASTTRLMLRKGAGDQRICKIYDSPSLPESECTFAISNGGIADVE